MAVDPVRMTLAGNYLRNVCHEMGIAMMKTSYSSIFNEGLDFSCVVFDGRGRAVASGEFCPAQIGAVLFTVDWTIQELGLEAFEEGDVVVHNDPYRGGCHLPEHMLLKPVFLDGRPVAFVANLAHLTEIGGKAPGGFAADATDVYQEGLRLPPVKLLRRGERNEDVWRIMLANHRTPRSTWGDLHAMIGSLNVGEARVAALLERFGLAEFERLSDALLDYSERRMRAEIAAIPDGRYAFEDVIENDGVDPDARYWIRVEVFVDGDEAIFDFRASDDQARGPCNTTFGVTASAVYNAMLHVTSPDIPRNSGCYRPIRILTRPGSVVNVLPPAPEVGGNSEISPRIVDLLFAALAPAVPDRVPASSGGTGCNFLFGGVHPETGEYYANYHMEGCGWGGRLEADGNSAQGVINGNCRNTPIEVFETRYPWRVRSLRLVPDSGGAGRWRGGLASERLLEVDADAIVVSEFADRTETRPWGLFGGQPGTSAATLVKRAGDDRFRTFGEAFGTVSNTKFSGVELRRGDQVLIRTAGGGGYGEPLRRPAALVQDDLENGLVSEEAVGELYGRTEVPARG
jgi:N-methylhydantoinase B/oxoprolinase/acetone carboxylase alpha subunit